MHDHVDDPLTICELEEVGDSIHGQLQYCQQEVNQRYVTEVV